MTPEMIGLHTGREVPRGTFVVTAQELSRLLTGTSLAEVIGGLELAQLAGDYLAQGRRESVGEAEARAALRFSYATIARTALMVEGSYLHSITMDVLAATLARPTETGYDVLDPITGKLIKHYEMI